MIVWSRKDGNSTLASHHFEVPPVQGEHPAAVAFGARDHTAVRESERKIRVTLRQLPDARQVLFAAFQSQPAGLQIFQEAVQNSESEPLFLEAFVT